MYPVGHILTDTNFSKVAADKLNLSFRKIFPVTVLTNLIDLDHLFNYHLDDGTANSLSLHPGHLYAGFIIFSLVLLKLFWTTQKDWIMVLIGGFSLHMAADAIAFWVDYDLISLVVIDFVLFGIWMLIRNKFDTSVSTLRLFLFLLVVTIISAGGQYFLTFILLLNPQQDVIVYIFPNAVFLLCGVGFSFLFDRKKAVVSS